MKGLVIATHADLGSELLRACELIIGPVERARAISVQRDDSVEKVHALFQDAIQAVGVDGEGVLVMADMMGGTPANIGAVYIEEDKVDILTGVNLPMVLKFFNSQEDLTLTELANILKAYGQKGVTLVSDLLKK